MTSVWDSSEILAAIKTYVDKFCQGRIKTASRAFGVNYQTVFAWCKGLRTPKLTTLGKTLDVLVAAGLLTDPNSLGVTGSTDSDEVTSLSERTKSTMTSDYAFIPRVEAVAGCGESLQTQGDVSDSLYAFRKEFLRREGIKTEDAVMMYVSGDSMEPTIMDKDTLLVDKRDNVPKDGYIYVLSLGDTLMVKRMQRIADGWLLRSDNPKYAPVTVQGQEQEKMVVHGRVRWFSRVI